ncbi:unnamed protein product [Didymodactylos carnosus]|uniref:Uncharacterized protein n=2 Tax=Didymodactylos carnosus TaxID=1234261 RepID=A0A8S2F5A7_9BILA|nr:unnamed protein product [Didymodactylos carnosus]CAF4159686.1 unnamed protein product [Didymodactylos carnosus]
MRWGIQDSAWEEHSTTRECLTELDRCYDYDSLATNSISDLQLIEKWYLLDTNPDRPFYGLQRMNKEFPADESELRDSIYWVAMRRE